MHKDDYPQACLFPVELELYNPQAALDRTFSKEGLEDFIKGLHVALGEAIKFSMDKGIIPNKLALKGTFYLERVSE